MSKIATTAGTLSIAAAILASGFAQGATYHHRRYHHSSTARAIHCQKEKEKAQTRDMIIGGVGGAVAGNLLTHGGGKTGGTLIGAGAGAYAGHEIGKRHKCR